MEQILTSAVLVLLGAALAPAQAPPPPLAPASPVPAFASERAFAHRESYLGVGVQEIDAKHAKELKLPGLYGVEVTWVDPDSPAAKAGLKQGDVVLEYNGQRVEGTQQFVRMVHETPPGHEVKLRISRNGETQTLTATIGEHRPPGPLGEWDIQKLPEDWRGMPFGPEMPDWPGKFGMPWGNPVLGIEAEPLTSQLAEFFGVTKGVLVRTVVEDSAAAKAGIKAGDVITKVDNQEVSTPAQVSRRIREIQPRKTFSLTVVRNHQERTVNVSVGQPPASEMLPE